MASDGLDELDETFSQEIGKVDNVGPTASSPPSSDSDLPSFMSTPSTSTPISKSAKLTFHRGDLVWAKHNSSFWPAVIKCVYKARRCATVVWADVDQSDRRKNISDKGFKVVLANIRPWACAERKQMITEGERDHGLKFENAVGMLDNFLLKKANDKTPSSIFDYLGSVQGSLYTLLDSKHSLDDSQSLDETMSPDIKRLRSDTTVSTSNSQSSLTRGVGVDSDEDADTDCNRNSFISASRNVRRNLGQELTFKKQPTSLETAEKIVTFVASDVCFRRLRDIHQDREKSFLKVFFQLRAKNLKDARLNNFGPLMDDDSTSDRVLESLKTHYCKITGKNLVNLTEMQYVMDVFLPEALSHFYVDTEGKSFNEALMLVWSDS